MTSVAIMLLFGAAHATPLERFQYSELHMGVRVNVTLYAKSTEQAETAAKAAFARFAELEAIMSDYRDDSELMRLCAKAGTGPIKVSTELFDILQRSLKLSEETAGAFDVTCGPVVKLWRQARQNTRLPDKKTLEHALSLVGFKYMKLDQKQSTVTLELPGMMIDLGGIAKGYACDEALKAMRKHGIESAMIEAGGDIAVSNPPPNKNGWEIAVRNLDGTLFSLKNSGISTSGDTEQFVEIDGVRYSHIVDPRTGIGLTNRVQVTVVASDATTSDSLATALCVLGEDAGISKKYGGRAYFVKSR
ncbi:MAG: FAD:protein FMN transferase [Fimbriimonadales bacterium]|nr:FAD:protein FMN transferase [Fimbriimonadales bacterium]